MTYETMNRRVYETMMDRMISVERASGRRRRSSPLRLFASSALLALLPLAAAAQPADERLPDLTPRAFEIRGDLQISLPNLERQPLRGFAPPPRTYVVPGDRRTFVAPYGQPLDGLPPDPLAEPAAPQASALAPLTGRIDAAAGRYLGRAGRVTLNSGGLGVDVRYAGHSSFQPFDDADRFDPAFDAAADVFDGHFTYATQGPTRVGFSLDGAYQRYHLVGSLEPAYDEPPLRTGRTVGASGFVDADGEALAFDLRAGLTSTAFSINDDRPGFDLDESRLEAEGGVRFDRLRLSAGGAFAGLDDDGFGESLTEYQAGGTFRLTIGSSEVEVGARFLGYTTSELNGNQSARGLGPVVRFEAPLGERVHVFARAEPRLEGGSLAALFRENPYAVPRPDAVAPSVKVLDGIGGLEVQSVAVRLTAYAGATWGPSLRYFERLLPLGTTAGLYEARYGGASIFRLGATATAYGPAGLRLSAGAEGRHATLSAGGDLSYFAPLTGHVSLSAPFASGRGLVQVTGTAEGARPTEVLGEDAPAWATLDAGATYRFAPGLSALARAERLAGRAEQWPGFPRPPTALLAGVRAQW